MVEEFYSKKPEMLADFTIETTISLARTIGIDHTRFLRSSEIEGVEGTKTDRLISYSKKSWRVTITFPVLRQKIILKMKSSLMPE